MLHTVALLTAAIALVCAIVLFFAVDRVPATRAGWVAVTISACVLPLLSIGSGTTYAVKTSSTTEFCLECHEMGNHGRSLFIDDRTVLPAVHYQNRLVDRERACYVCHTNYAMFGDLQAKLNGLTHLYVHYLGEIPEEFELYEPYPNANCLHCHEDARRTIEAAPHAGKLEALHNDEISCLDCHSKGHALDQVEEGNFWLGP